MQRFWLCTAALGAIAVPAAADAPLPKADAHAAAPAHGGGAPKLALLAPQVATPTRDAGGAVAPLPRGNPGDVAVHERADADAAGSAGAEARGRDTEAKGSCASPGESRPRDAEGK